MNKKVINAIISRIIILLHPAFLSYYFGLSMITYTMYLLCKSNNIFMNKDIMGVYGVVIMADILVAIYILAHVILNQKPNPKGYPNTESFYMYPLVIIILGTVVIISMFIMHFGL